MTPLSILGIGLLLGIKHATDADHVVAVSTIVTQQKKLKSASIIGALWGIGHTTTVFIVGVAIILFHLVIPPRVGLMLEFIVAIALIILGILNLKGRGSHAHLHAHAHALRPFAIGLVHGLAGSAAIALLILSSITDPWVAVLYLLIFGIGTIIGMMGITTLIGVPLIASSNKFENFTRYITIASGVLSLVFGLYLAYEIGVTQQLFGPSPQWDPH